MNKKIDILLVDDRPENLFALEMVLQAPDYNLIKVNSGNDALKYLLENECALILMDVQMPGMDGYETASYIKKDEKSRFIPIIFITAINKDDRFVSLGYKTGAVDYISKPFDPEILKSKVEVFAELFRVKEQVKEQALQIRANDLKESERALALLELKSLRRDQAAQKKYRDLVDGINHGIIWSADVESLSFSFVSPAAEKLLGYPLEKWYSELGFFLNHIHPDDLELFKRYRQSARTNKDVGFEHRIYKANGAIAWYHTGMRLAQKTDSTDLELRGLSIDITAIKEAEAALRKSEERARIMADVSLLLSESLDGQSLLSKVGELAVPRFADFFMIDVLDDRNILHCKSVANVDSRRLVLDHNREKDAPCKMTYGVHHVMETGKSEIYSHISEENLMSLCPDAESLKFLQKLGSKSAIIVPLHNRSRTFGAMTLISADSNNRYQNADLVLAEEFARRTAIALDNASLYKQAQDAVRARDEFLSVASHELKTPLTPLRLNMQSMKRRLEKGTFAEIFPEKLQKIIDTSERQIVRLSQLIDDLLDISRINIGQLNLNLERFNLCDLVKDIVERFAAESAQAKCKVQVDCSEAFGYWDRFRTEQIVTNLFTNALKYGAGNPITIQVKEENKIAILTVRDNGIGIDKKDHHRIFERFERAVSPYNFRGLGLGLFIVKQLISMHFGDIRVESSPGEGSTFIVELPTDLIAREGAFHVLDESTSKQILP